MKKLKNLQNKVKEEENLNQKTSEIRKFKEQNKKAVEEKKQKQKELVLNEANHTKKIKHVNCFYILQFLTNFQEVKQKKTKMEEEIFMRNTQSVQKTKNSEKELVLKKQDFKVN